MKYHLWLYAAILAILPFYAYAEESELPQPAPESGVVAESSLNPDASEVNEAKPVEETAPAKDDVAKMLEFFDGLNQAIDNAKGDCAKTAEIIGEYYSSHQEWVNSLDYATVNANAQTIEIVREKAVEFGKKLSVCYDEPKIPSLLRKYAGMSEDFL